MDAAEVAELNNNLELLRTGNFADCTFIVGSDKKVKISLNLLVSRICRYAANQRFILGHQGTQNHFDEEFASVWKTFLGRWCAKQGEIAEHEFRPFSSYSQVIPFAYLFEI